MKNIIFYFTGTGNSFYAAKKVKEMLGDCEMIPMGSITGKMKVKADQIGFVYPVYFWGIPNVVEKAIRNIEIEDSSYIFAVATCASAPGASLNQVAELLDEKERRLNGGFYVYMPDNYIVSVDIAKPEKVSKKLIKTEVMLKKVLTLIKTKEEKIHHNRLGIDRLMGKAINSYVVSRYPEKDIGFHVTEDCIQCGRCEKVCGVGNIKLEDGKPVWQHHCEFCLGCLNLCPACAIEYKNKTKNHNRYCNPLYRP